MTKRKAAEVMALVVAELARGPATVGELCAAIGASPSRSDRAQTYIKPLRAVGAVRVCGWVNRRTPVLALQAPFALPDEPMPGLRRERPKTSRRLSAEARFALAVARKHREDRAALLAMGPNSVFALGAR